MRCISRRSSAWLVISLAVLSLRALTPDGYMPGSAGSGLLFELCPSAMPDAIMQALRGGHHHHHHGDAGSAASSEHCPIGHMLSAAVAVDSNVTVDLQTASATFEPELFTLRESVRTTPYRSRAPPA